MSEDFYTSYVFDPNEELDLSGEGFQRQRALFQIVEAEIRPTKAGDGAVLVITFESTEPVNGIDALTVNDYIVTTHPEVRVAKMGRGRLAKLFEAVFGTKRGSINALVGRIVSAEVWEDDEGFRRIGRYRSVEGNGPAASISEEAAGTQLEIPF